MDRHFLNPKFALYWNVRILLSHIKSEWNSPYKQVVAIIEQRQIQEIYLLQCPVTILSPAYAQSNQNWEIFRLKQLVQERKPSVKFPI